jgi:hypothetical protein
MKPPSQEGRDFVEAKRLIESAVVEGSPPLTVDQVAPLIIGRPAKVDEAMLQVGVTLPGTLRAALLSGVGGIEADPSTSSIRRREVDEIFREVWLDRQASWTPLVVSEPLEV